MQEQVPMTETEYGSHIAAIAGYHWHNLSRMHPSCVVYYDPQEADYPMLPECVNAHSSYRVIGTAGRIRSDLSKMLRVQVVEV